MTKKRDLQPLAYQMRGFEPGAVPGLDQYVEISTVLVLSPDVIYIGGFLSRSGNGEMQRNEWRAIRQLLKKAGYRWLQCYRPSRRVPCSKPLAMPGHWLIDLHNSK